VVCAAGEEKTLGPFLCFLHQTPCDVLVKGHKVVGSAQRRSRGALLQHGAILLAQSPHTPLLAGLHELAGFDPSPESRAALQNELITELRHDTGWILAPGEWTADELQRRVALAAEKYGSPLWNEKR
jgi:lipoate-protein ligase A